MILVRLTRPLFGLRLKIVYNILVTWDSTWKQIRLIILAVVKHLFSEFLLTFSSCTTTHLLIINCH